MGSYAAGCSSVFRSLGDASAFFEPGALGYSATADGSRLDGVVLRTRSWRVEPLSIDRVFSSYFADRSLLPAGSVTFDCALLMRDIEHEWQAAAGIEWKRAAGADLALDQPETA